MGNHSILFWYLTSHLGPLSLWSGVVTTDYSLTGENQQLHDILALKALTIIKLVICLMWSDVQLIVTASANIDVVVHMKCSSTAGIETRVLHCVT